MTKEGTWVQGTDYKIVDLDYWENDGILEVEGERFYFQWDGTREPTLLDALISMRNENKFNGRC